MAVPSEMKAWRVHAYGEEGNPADTISKMTLDTIPMPEPKPGQVLIKVELAAVNPIDWKLFSGGMQLAEHFQPSKHGICPVTFPYVPGFDVAGTVVKLGEGVGNVQVGDEVIADLGLVETCKTESPCGPAGAFAQYTVALASTVAKREGIPAKELVGLPLAGLTSYQALFTGAGGDFTGAPLGTLAPGQKLLVLGGAAATGAIAVQLGRAIGAEVATTASPNKMPDGTNKLDYMKKLGADDVINYKEADWSDVKAGANVDLIYDCVGTEEDWPKASKVLKKGGKFVTIANFGDAKSTEDHSFQAFLIKSDSEDLKTHVNQVLAKKNSFFSTRKLVQFVKEGKLTVPVDCVVPFEDVPKVLTKSMGWASAGKLVIQVA